MKKVIEVSNVTKSFTVERPLHKQLFALFSPSRKVPALKNISFYVSSGEILGVLGPNGAGKTTLLRILADLLQADYGRLRICGRDSGRKNRGIRSRIGYVSSDERSFFWRLSGRHNLEFFARLYDIPRELSQNRIEQMLQTFQLKQKSQELFRDYSTGTRKKFSLIRALIHQPDILLLDELTNSLDAGSARKVKSLVRSYICDRPDRAAIWSTHRFEEIEQVCDRVLIIDKGSMNFFGSIKNFKQEHQKQQRPLLVDNIFHTRRTGSSQRTTVFSSKY